MERCTIRLPERQLHDLESLVNRGEYPNRSEAIRAAVREMLKEDKRVRRERLRAPREYRNAGGNGVAEVNPGP